MKRQAVLDVDGIVYLKYQLPGEDVTQRPGVAHKGNCYLVDVRQRDSEGLRLEATQIPNRNIESVERAREGHPLESAAKRAMDTGSEYAEAKIPFRFVE